MVKLAVLIDADNAQPRMAGPLLAEIAKYGTSFVKRAYGDWTGHLLNGWKDQLLVNSIQPIQQFAYTRHKNSTDAAMVIDAMDLLYTNRFDGFCLVSSDSDFTRLASRIRESGLVVYGFGEHKTPQSLVTACDKFIYTENLQPEVAAFSPRPERASSPTGGNGSSGGGGDGGAASAAESAAATMKIWTARNLIRKAIAATSDDDGWANLASVGGIVTKWRPDFDARSFGYEKLSEMISADNSLETTRRTPGTGKPPVIYVRGKSSMARRDSRGDDMRSPYGASFGDIQ